MQSGRHVTDTSIESSEPIESRGSAQMQINSNISYKEVNAVWANQSSFQGRFPCTNKTPPPLKVTAVMNSQWFLSEGALLD